MIRGTTPRILIEMEGLPETEIKKTILTLSQGPLTIDREVKVERGIISCRLTQEETLQLKAYSQVKIQVKMLLADGQVLASDIVSRDVEQILNEDVLK